MTGTSPGKCMPRVTTIPTFELENGAVLNQVAVGYERWGTLNEMGDNVIVVGHSLTSSPNAKSWWPGCIGPGKALDTDKFFVVCANVIGSPYGTISPISINPVTGRPYGNQLPQANIRDTVRLHKMLLDSLGVRRIAFVIGGSMGGMQALEWAYYGPDYVQAIVPIAVGGRHTSWCIAWSEAQRQAIYADPNWKGGTYEPQNPPQNGLAAARMMAMVSYRSLGSFEPRFGRRRDQTGSFNVESWIQHHGTKLVNRFDPACYVYLTRLMDTHDVARGRGSYRAALGSIMQSTLAIGIRSDILYLLEEQEELFRNIPNAELSVMEGPHGHDTFLIDQDELNETVLAWRLSKVDPFVESFSTDQMNLSPCS
ncbi:MAG: homoserine O-acetyltransferase [Bacteroidetes bacterium]|nr:homoserine O-acetyltransferase [Bacteroidota bacterium]